MSGMKNTSPATAHVGTMTSRRKRIRRITRTIGAYAALARALARLVWWIAVTAGIVCSTARAILEGDPTDLARLLTAAVTHPATVTA